MIWATYLIVSIVPRYKNPAIKLFFNFLDIAFGVYLFSVFAYANKLYFDKTWNCHEKAPIMAYFTESFLIICYGIFIILGLAVLAFIFKKCSKKGADEIENLEEIYN